MDKNNNELLNDLLSNSEQEEKKQVDMSTFIEPQVLAELTVYLISTTNSTLIKLHAKLIKKIDLKNNYNLDDDEKTELVKSFVSYYKTLNFETPEKYIKLMLAVNIAMSVGGRWIDYLTTENNTQKIEKVQKSEPLEPSKIDKNVCQNKQDTKIKSNIKSNLFLNNEQEQEQGQEQENNYEKKSKIELQKLAKLKKIKINSNCTKTQIINELKENENESKK